MRLIQWVVLRPPIWVIEQVLGLRKTSDRPSPGDKRAELHWFWEPAHYRHELGDSMLSSMLNQQCWNSDTQSKFGVNITESSLQHHLDGLRSGLDGFLDENPQVVRRLNSDSL